MSAPVLLVVAPATPAAAAVPSGSHAAGSLGAANATAAVTGRRVEATSRRTELSQTFANPDGTLTLEQSAVPTRVRRGDSWVPVDMTLRRAQDGAVRPAASAVSMAFSGGGAKAPLAEIGRGATRLRLSWPAALPTPTLAANTATYAEVLPGVDLVVTADPDTFSEVLVVKTAQAARQPALRSIRLGTSVSDGRIRADAGGGFSVVDRNGAAILTSPAAQMWDSAGAASAAARGTAGGDRVRGPREGDRVAAMAEQVTASSVTIQPDSGMLTGPTTRFPLFIDPSVTASQHSRAMIDKSFPSQEYYGWGGADEGIGYQNFSGVDTKRLFFSFNTGTVARKVIQSATLAIYETSASSCSPRAMEAWRTGAFGPATNWSNGAVAGMWISRVASINTAAGRSTCLPGGSRYEFNVAAAVSVTAGAGGAFTYLGLKAASETDNLAWRRITAGATLSITYNTPPATPTGLRTTSPTTSCASGAGRPVINDPTPVLTAYLGDADSQNVFGEFALYRLGEATPYLYFKSTTSIANRDFSPAAVTNFGTAPASFAWQVHTYDGFAWSPWSARCEFTIDTTVPSPPTVAPKGATFGASDPLTFTVTAAADVIRIRWALNADGPTNDVDMSRTPYTFTVPPVSTGPQWVMVWAYDAAGNQTIADRADFTVSAPLPAGRWRLDDNSGTTAADSAGTHPMTLSGTASWRTDGRWYDPAFTPGDHALQFAAAGGGGTAAVGVGHVVRTDNHYTVMADLRPAVSSIKQVAMSEDGSTYSGFTLGAKSVSLDPSGLLNVTWAFSVVLDATTGVAAPVNCDTLGVDPAAWTHLAGRYDAAQRRVDIFVDGVPCAAASVTLSAPPVDSPGAVRIGRALYGGVASGFWTGDVDDAQVWNGYVSNDDIAFWARTSN